MSYCRWGTRGCDGQASGDWFVFAHSDGGLAMWGPTEGANATAAAPIPTTEIRRMVASGDPSAVPGYKPEYREELLRYMRYYLDDEDNDPLPWRVPT